MAMGDRPARPGRRPFHKCRRFLARRLQYNCAGTVNVLGRDPQAAPTLLSPAAAGRIILQP